MIAAGPAAEDGFLSAVDDAALAKSYFERVIAGGSLAHAYLLWGERGSGKHRFARELAKALFCREGDPCGQCSSCRSIEHGNHAGVHVFGPPEGKTIVDIDTVRRLCDRVQLGAGELKLVILEHADAMNEPAANALLKTLEEPPPRTLLLLTARSTGSLLDTIVSRCHRVPFVSGLDRGDAVRALGAEILADLHASVSSVAHDPKAWLSQRFPDAGSTREGVRQLLETLLAALRPAAAPEVASGSETDLDLDRRLARCETVLELLAALDGNVNADLVFEKLVGDLARISR